MANNIDLTICALECPLGTFQCSAWLIQLRQRTALSPLKRSCSRFASLTLRTPHRSPVSSPLAAAAALWLPCVRGAVRRQAGLRGCLRVRGKGKGPAVPFPSLRTEPALRAAPVFRSAYSASRNARASAAFAASIEAHCAFSSKTLLLQVRFAHPPNCAPKPSFRRFRCSAWLILRFRTIAHTGAGVSLGLFDKPKCSSFSRIRDLHRSAPRCLL